MQMGHDRYAGLVTVDECTMWTRGGDSTRSNNRYRGPKYISSYGPLHLLPLIDPCLIWDEMGDNSAPLKENCTLFAPTPYFRVRAIPWCHLNFPPANPRCHGNEFWDKIGYNSAPVKDNCALFAPTPYFRGRAI